MIYKIYSNKNIMWKYNNNQDNFKKFVYIIDNTIKNINGNRGESEKLILTFSARQFLYKLFSETSEDIIEKYCNKILNEKHQFSNLVTKKSLNVVMFGHDIENEKPDTKNDLFELIDNEFMFVLQQYMNIKHEKIVRFSDDAIEFLKNCLEEKLNLLYTASTHEGIKKIYLQSQEISKVGIKDKTHLIMSQNKNCEDIKILVVSEILLRLFEQSYMDSNFYLYNMGTEIDAQQLEFFITEITTHHKLTNFFGYNYKYSSSFDFDTILVNDNINVYILSKLEITGALIFCHYLNIAPVFNLGFDNYPLINLIELVNTMATCKCVNKNNYIKICDNKYCLHFLDTNLDINQIKKHIKNGFSYNKHYINFKKFVSFH